MEYFVTEVTSGDDAAPARENDTTCVFTTSPKQPTGLIAVTAVTCH